MVVEHLEIVDRTPYRDGRPFGDVGAYERVDAVARYAVDPLATENEGIVDLKLVGQDDDGLVRFNGDVTLLRPVDVRRSSRTALVEVPNRGRRTAGNIYNRSPAVTEPTYEIDPGDGFLLRRGWTMAWCGWQWDVPRSPARMGLDAPVVLGEDGLPESALVQLRLQPHRRANAVTLTDHHVGLLGGHTPLPTADVADTDARLLVRDRLWGQAAEVARETWRFARDVGGHPVPDVAHVWLDGGFDPGRIYDLIYETTPVRMAGAGLLAVRDFGSFLRQGHSPSEGELDHLIVTGQSQCGRFLRSFLELGLNRGDDGTAAYDGVLAHIAGGRRGEFNHRGAQPSVQPTPSFGHRFPFSDDPQTDGHSGEQAGLLDLQRHVGCVPKIFYTNTSSEYWRGDASLTHSDVNDGSDLEPPSEARSYLLSSTQHSSGTLPLISESIFGSQGGNHFNVIDYSPLMRAALMNLHDWIVDDVEPPPNAIPRLSDGTAADRPEVLRQVAAIPHLARPGADALSTIRPLDLGSGAADGIGSYPAMPAGDAYPCVVSTLDNSGNERAGIRMPDVEVPVATHTGWNPRHSDTGAPDQILEYVGSTIPFTVDAGARQLVNDPRPSIGERYATRDIYLAQVRSAAETLLARRHLVEEDVDVCVQLAAARYDAITTGETS
ncbi:MAG: hypothetical protein ACI8TP_002337 [Acidimicrobiales bacterium]